MLQLTHQPPSLFASFEDEMFHHVGQVTHPENDGCDTYDTGLDFDMLPDHIYRLYINAGHFSSVWSIPGEPTQVLKISHRDDDACRYYMQWAKEHPHRHAPRIHKITYRENLMMVRMQRYYTHPDRGDSFIYRENIPGYNVLLGYKNPDHDNGVEQFCAQIRRVFRGHQFDLHKDNILVDHEGVIIITDPVSFTGESGYVPTN